MATSRKTKRVTAETLYTLPEYPFYELYDGVLRVRDPSGAQSSNVAAELAITLGGYVRTHNLGKIFVADHGCVLARNPDTVVAPDLSFLRRERLVYGKAWEKFTEGAPDLAVEVISPSDRVSAVERKARLYIASKCPLVWIIDPRKRIAIIYRAVGDPKIIPEDGILDGEHIIPGFQCTLASLL